jgi:TPP-dependent pyruvate/acetoin dehydrogenase alpha subunit
MASPFCQISKTLPASIPPSHLQSQNLTNYTATMKATNLIATAGTLPADIPASVIAQHDRFSLISGEKLHALYAAMVRSRIIAGRLHLQLPAGHLTPIGAEAAAAGVIAELLPHDCLVLSHSNLVPALLKGVPLELILSGLNDAAAKPRKARRGTPGNRRSSPLSTSFEYAPANVIATSASVSARLNLAAGLAHACKMQDHGGIVAVFAGRDSATRAASTPAAWQKSWIETLRLAGSARLPILFVCQSNMAVEDARPAKDSTSQQGNHHEEIGIDTQPFGYPSIPVDGNDAVAVYRAAGESIFRIRQGRGPTLIDCRTWQIEGRAAADACDPIRSMENYLASRNLFSAEYSRQLSADFNQELDSALAAVTRQSRKVSF